MWLIARLLLLTAVVGLVCVGNAAAQTSDPDYALTGIGGSMQPDLFTGTASTSIPIQVPPGRHGIQPALSLQYWSGNGDGWLGPGWKLEVGAIQRQTRFGVNYSGDDYSFRLAGVSTDLVSIGSGEYRAKIEGGFSRVKKLTAGDGKPYWEATDKKGTRYLFGQTAMTRQADPADANKIFKWCLDQVIDANGNYMTVTYFGDQGQGYLDHIDYTGNGSTQPTNTVKFYLEDRPDAPPMYTTNFLVTTAKRLKTIDVLANGNRVRTYKLSYTISSSTSRSMLSSVQQYGKDATLDGTGTVTGGTALPAVTFSWQGAAGGSFGSQYYSFGGIAGFDLLSTADRIVQLDYNGDGKSDLVLYRPGAGAIAIARSNGDGTFTGVYYSGSGIAGFDLLSPGDQVFSFDYNGDGKSDLVLYRPGAGAIAIARSNGDGTFTGVYYSGSGIAGADLLSSYDRMFPFDYNGDGRADIAIYRPGSGFISVARSDGKGGFGSEYYSFSGIAGDDLLSVYDRILPLDYNGDGRADITAFRPGSGFITIARSNGDPSDLVASMANGLGATTTIAYKPSTQYTNTQLPFPIQTVNSITTNDGNGNVSTTTYTFSGGFYHIGERDLRGFNYAKVMGPVGPNGEQTISETWFHQGIDLAVDTNTPNVPDGYMKGKPYRVRVSDGSGHIYSEVTTSYASGPSTAPFFNPPLQVDTNICDGGTCGKQTRTIYTYDTYGNVTREDQYGDLSDTSDDRTVSRTFSPNTTAWIVGLPSSETIYQGIGLANQMAATSFYYDGVTDCTVASSNVTPTLGNLTRVVRTLTGGVNPETRMAYDAYGNLICTRDANGNTTTMNYDGSFTFPKVVTNPLGHQKTTQYYGVDGVAADSGLYGQVKSVTDPNTAVITTTYDVFGRKLQVNFPDGGSTSTSYNSFGTVGSQNIQTNTQAGLSTLTYFDGLGRTITEKKTGPDAKTIAAQTQYNVRGAVLQTSLPYFFGIDSPSWKTFIYDPVGRVTQATNPDSSRALSCTSNWVTVTIDPNNHRRRETRDAYGRLAKVEEYTGTSSICDTSAGTPYATTTYQYDVLGNLLTVTDARGNQSTMTYDSLSRKTAMHDPDMGNWTYAYDAAGNLTSQTDARGQVIYFQYDELNRRKQKDYGTQKALGSGDVMYIYDAVTSNGKGRLTGVQDQSGSVLFYYDTLGRTTRSDKSVDGTTYITQTSYDTLGRVLTIMYPDNAVVSYAYNGPLLLKAYEGTTNYGQYAGYNALGQPGTMTFGNGVVTTYTYSNSGNMTCSQQNFRPCTIKTVLGTNPAYQDLSYSYDTGGNVTAITDAVNGNQTFGYDALNRLTSATGPYGSQTYSYDEIGNMLSNPLVGTYSYPVSGASSVRPHAVSTAGSNSYGYDNNGNLTSGAGRTLTYDFENRPTSITSGGVTTTMVYDGDGGRVKKIAGTLTVRYIGKLYECDNATCVKYIFAGDKRIAVKQVSNGLVDYYHQDHLGSSSVVTHGTTGAQEENITYYPYGAARTNTSGTTPPTDVPYKYNGKELDNSTGLYFYGARYYDATLGRFISADTIVPSAADPQSLNRYSYVRNNPIVLTDPTGHFSIGGFFKDLGRALGWAVDPYLMAFVDPKTTRSIVNFVADSQPLVLTGIMSREQGRQMLGAEIIAATAIVTFYCGGCGAVATGALWGALVGEIAGGVSGHGINLNGVVMGGLTGAATGAAMAEVGVLTKGFNPVERILAKAVAGGLISEIRGGEFGAGFEAAGGSAVFAEFWAYARQVTNGKAESAGVWQKDASGELNTFGDRVCATSGGCGVPSMPESNSAGFLNKLGSFGVFLNAVSKVHDFFNQLQGGYNAYGYQIPGAVSGWQNVGGMVPAAGITAIARDGGVLSVDYATRRSR